MWFDPLDLSNQKKLLDLGYIYPRGVRGGVALFFLEKSVFLKHPNRHAGTDIGNFVFNCSSVIDGVALWATHGRHEKLPMVERLPELRSPSFHFWQQLTPHIHLWYNVRELLCSTEHWALSTEQAEVSLAWEVADGRMADASLPAPPFQLRLTLTETSTWKRENWKNIPKLKCSKRRVYIIVKAIELVTKYQNQQK